MDVTSTNLPADHVDIVLMDDPNEQAKSTSSLPLGPWDPAVGRGSFKWNWVPDFDGS